MLYVSLEDDDDVTKRRLNTARPFLAACALALLAALFCVAPVSAHPLGNFTINHLTKLTFGGKRIAVRYVLDMAEIPTFSALREANLTGSPGRHDVETLGRAQAGTLLPQLQLTVDGVAAPLVMDGVAARTRPGAGGLPTLYLRIDAHTAALPAGARRIAYRDATFAGRLGWHDVAVTPEREPTDELQSYPNALLASPRDTSAVDVTLGPGGSVAAVAPVAAAAAAGSGVPSAARSNQLSDMLARGTSDWGFVALTFLVAIALGALHALEPGHGKTLLAISLVGARATVGQAAILAAALTIAHTIGVLALGVAINVFKGYFVPETIYPWITLLSGITIAFIGARAVHRQIEARRPLAHAHAHDHAATHPHEHEHVHHTHASDHDHGHGHEHGEAHSHEHDDFEHARSHAIPGHAPLKFGATVWAAMSGGVAPCPAALVVLLAALALDRVAYGILVIIAFSFGLALTLTGLGIAVVRGAGWLQRRPAFDRFVQHGPLVSAIVISSIGAIMVGQGFAERGYAISPLVISALVALAIVGYAFSHPFAHRRAEVA